MADNGGAWTVTSQAQEYGRLDGGEYGEGMRVHFVTASGARGSVLVPLDQYTPGRVTERVAARAMAMDHVSTLTGG